MRKYVQITNKQANDWYYARDEKMAKDLESGKTFIQIAREYDFTVPHVRDCIKRAMLIREVKNGKNNQNLY